MKKYYIILLVVMAMALVAGCTSNQKSNGIKITAGEAKEKMAAGGVTVVDVRTAEEYEQGHIEGAVLIPNETIGQENIDKLPKKDAVILVYCRSGRRSADAASKLVGLGYSKVYDFGGISDWTYGTVVEK